MDMLFCFFFVKETITTARAALICSEVASYGAHGIQNSGASQRWNGMVERKEKSRFNNCELPP